MTELKPLYDELVRSIRQNACHFGECGMCPRGKIPCLDRLALQAADAIEELSVLVGVVETGGRRWQLTK